jgi:hypothetical protein
MHAANHNPAELTRGRGLTCLTLHEQRRTLHAHAPPLYQTAGCRMRYRTNHQRCLRHLKLLAASKSAPIKYVAHRELIPTRNYYAWRPTWEVKPTAYSTFASFATFAFFAYHDDCIRFRLEICSSNIIDSLCIWIPH